MGREEQAMSTETIVKLEIELTPDQAAALYKLVRSMGFADLRAHAGSDDEAYEMRNAMWRVRSAIEQ
jgi:hypothetical protein